MKKVLDKIAEIIAWIFGYGIMISLFVGGLSFFGYVVALIVGGETATQICNFIYKDVFPILIYATSVLVLLGLLKMYLKGETALSSGKKIKKVSEEKKEEQSDDGEKTDASN